VIWFDFDALCAGPRGTADYVEIARDFHTVLVSRVPVFDASMDDPARRFIALVDEFYDRSVKLVVSADAPPEQLYRGERLAFESSAPAAGWPKCRRTSTWPARIDREPCVLLASRRAIVTLASVAAAGARA